MNSAKVFVGNLSFFCGRNELENLFSACGSIENIHLCTSETGETMHFAFVTFGNEDQAIHAMKTLNNSLFMGRNMWYVCYICKYLELACIGC